MAEIMGFLAAGQLSVLWEDQSPSESLSLSYQDLTWLRPRYGSSSWRVTLGKLVQKRWVLKSSADGRTVFQLTKLGWEQFKSLYPVFSARSGSEWMLAAYRSSQSGSRSQVRSILEQAGYQPIFPGLAIRPAAEYSADVSRRLQNSGVQAVFIPFDPRKSSPFPVTELFSPEDRLLRLSRESEKISKLSSELIIDIQNSNKLKEQTKERVGSIYVSGLSFFSKLRWFDREEKIHAEKYQRVLFSLDSIMRKYSEMNSAWKK